MSLEQRVEELENKVRRLQDQVDSLSIMQESMWSIGVLGKRPPRVAAMLKAREIMAKEQSNEQS